MPGFPARDGARGTNDLAVKWWPRDLTTPEEYALQFYEGASTVYGPASGPLIEDRLTRLAARFADPPGVPDKAITYSPGPGATFGLADVKPDAFSATGFEGLLYDGTGQPIQDAPKFCWLDRLPTFPSPPEHAGRVTPEVAIEVRRDGGAWRPLVTSEGGEETDRGINFITTASVASPVQSLWCVTWLGRAPGGRAIEARFHVTTLDGISLYAPLRGERRSAATP